MYISARRRDSQAGPVPSGMCMYCANSFHAVGTLALAVCACDCTLVLFGTISLALFSRLLSLGVGAGSMMVQDPLDNIAFL